MLALNLARVSAGSNICLHIISSKGGALESDFRSSSEHFRIVPRKTFFDPVFTYRIYRYCRENNITVIHCHQLLECFNALFISLLLRVEIYLTYHGYYYFSKNSLVKLIGMYVAKKVALNIFVSKSLRDYYLEKYPLKSKSTFVLYNGVPLTDENEYDKTSLREEAGAGINDVVLGMTGNFSPARNQLLVCKAFRRLIENHPEPSKFKLIFVGKEDNHPLSRYREAITYCRDAGISGKVYFAGLRREAARLVKNFDLFVYSSRRETFCLSVVEAMAAGIPVIVNDLPVMKEITENGEFASVYTSDDENDLYLKLKEAVGNIQIFREKAISLKDKIRSRYSVGSHLGRLTEIYNHS
mgnify:CR=1 FL=1